MGSNLSEHKLNIDYYMQKMLYTNLMVVTNKKSVIDKAKNKKEGKQIYH